MAQQSSTASLSSKLNFSKRLPYNAGDSIMARKSAVEKTVARINEFREGTISLKHMTHEMISLVLHGTFKAVTKINRKLFCARRH